MNPIYLIILSIIGFGASFYIFHNKIHNKKLFCIIGKDCDAVVNSKYGKTFGVENTLVGMIYYLGVCAYGIGILLNQNLFKGSIIYYLIVSASLASALFSVYLAGVQAFVLKKYCEYCIVSTIASILILIILVA